MKEAQTIRHGMEGFSSRVFGDFKPKIDRRSMPANDIPLERGFNHVHLKSTAKHEGFHAETSIALGKGLSLLTVERKGNVLGSVTPARVDNVAAFQVIAMASSADDHPEGTGSDVYKAEMLQYEKGGISKDSALRTATKIVNRYSAQFWDKLSDLIAWSKNVSESRFKQLKARAEWEVQREQEIKTQNKFPREGTIFQRQQAAPLTY